MYVAIPLEMVGRKNGETMMTQVEQNHDSAYAFVAGTGLNIYILTGTITLYRRLILSFTVKIVHNVPGGDVTSEM